MGSMPSVVTSESTLRVEPSPKRVRVMLDGRYVADSISPLLVWEKPYYPTYFFPRSAVDESIIDSTHTYMRADGGLTSASL